MVLNIASRGSALALWQANHVKRLLEDAHDGLEVHISIQRTTGDNVTDVPLARIGDKGLFTKEVDRAVHAGEADLAVHSLKDIPTDLEPGLELGAISPREDPRDAVVCRSGGPTTLEDLPDGARIGTSSLRRRAQLLALRDDLRIDDLRGNLDTRLERVASGDFDAVILALAGIRRLEREDAVHQILEPPAWLPAVGQGALGIAIRHDDDRTRELIAVLDDHATHAATTAERAMLNALEGGCQVPIGALATADGDMLHLHGLVASLDGRHVIRGEARGHLDSADAVGRGLAQDLLDRGAGPILDEIRRQTPGTPVSGP